jgi:hypothetical protein
MRIKYSTSSLENIYPGSDNIILITYILEIIKAPGAGHSQTWRSGTPAPGIYKKIMFSYIPIFQT